MVSIVQDDNIRDYNNSEKVASLISKALFQMGCDEDSFETDNWNPLGKWITSGQTVLLKPNWVEHYNHNKNGSMDCLVTHPYVLKTLLDFVVIALNGSGRIIVADAPMQGCDLPTLLKKMGYLSVFDEYNKKGINIEVIDLRKYHVDLVGKGVISNPIYTKSKYKSKIVNLGELSLHSEKDKKNPSYKVTDYLRDDTKNYHGFGKHCYEVNELPLKADVIINIPKPKSHRLAGMTAGIKNFVGITYEKSSLPHRIEGSKTEGGDAYRKASFWKKQMGMFDEKRTENTVKGNVKKAFVFDILMKACYLMGWITTGDKYRIGSWYGNDTIWRTSADLNRIIIYADKDGNICEIPQRKVISIGDMIISGQGNGPVAPDDKPLGMIVVSDNTLLFDRAICEIMGFDYKKLPIFNNQEVASLFGYQNEKEVESDIVILNGKKMHLKELKTKNEWAFKPHDCWLKHIEKEHV